MSSISESTKSSWMDVTNESVHTSDDKDIGDIEAINRDFIVVKQGFVHVHRYYIPMNKVEGWDGHVVWLTIPEEQVKSNYQREQEPDAGRFYIQNMSYDKFTPFTSDYFPQMPIIPAKSRMMPSITNTAKTTQEAKGAEQPRLFKCDLCDAAFRTDDELSSHVSAVH